MHRNVRSFPIMQIPRTSERIMKVYIDRSGGIQKCLVDVYWQMIWKMMLWL